MCCVRAAAIGHGWSVEVDWYGSLSNSRCGRLESKTATFDWSSLEKALVYSVPSNKDFRRSMIAPPAKPTACTGPYMNRM